MADTKNPKNSGMININLNGFRYRSKIAGLDYDHTLVKPKTKSVFSKDVDDWMWLRPSVPVMLRLLHEHGYALVVFTNQSQKFKVAQIKKALSTLDLPISIFIETEKEFKKPNPRMYNTYVEGKKRVNKEHSFYVGDALGRPGDFADSDKGFAVNSGIKYKSPEEIFPFPARAKSQSSTSLPDHREIVLMVGYPGSGKSTYAQKTFGDNEDYIIIHGDDHKTEAALKKALKKTLTDSPNKSVVLDATHSGKKKRKVFIDIAKEFKIPVRAIHITTSIEESMHRNLQREKHVPKIALYMYRKHHEVPDADEGLYKVDTI
jgi:bifunctional polynucleotide phosphatase/kinase